MLIIKKVVLFVTASLLLSLLLSACALESGLSAADPVVSVRQRDLVEQIRTGNGEGLAKAVPGRALLINNQLLFGMMGSDAVLGISMTVGTIKETVELFNDLAPLALEEKLGHLLTKKRNDRQWNEMIGRLTRDNKRLLLEPYLYLNGYPDAVLETRIRLVLEEAGREVCALELKVSSEKRSLQGENAWSSGRGALLSQEADGALIEALNRIDQEFIDQVCV